MSYQNCHNCGCTWSPGSSEWEWQQCSACGWRPGMPIDDFDDEDDLYEGNRLDEIEAAEDEENMRQEILIQISKTYKE